MFLRMVQTVKKKAGWYDLLAARRKLYKSNSQWATSTRFWLVDSITNLVA
jgi:hypothetical protein